MKLLILSDLHHEFGMLISIPEDLEFDVVILAGDIDVRDRGGLWALGVFDCPIIYVTGNHEYYGTTTTKVHRHLTELDEQNANFHYLNSQNKPSVEIDGVVFVGATLWTDFKLSDYDPRYDQSTIMRLAYMYMNDYARITTYVGGIYRKIKSTDVLGWHQKDKDSIENACIKAGLKKTVVVTHHAPSPKSINERYQNDIDTNPYFASNLDDFITSLSPNLWIHGHMHDPVDYMIGDTRVFSNPRGYVMPPKYNSFSVYRERGEEDVFSVIEV